MKSFTIVTGVLVGALLVLAPHAQAQAPRGPLPTGRPQLWAIVVGVGNPLDVKIRAQSSREAAQQSLAVQRWITGPAGWDRTHVLQLTDLAGNDDPGTVESPAPNIKPTKQNLDWAFREWLAPRAKAGDVIVFYYAGQSRSVPKGNPTAGPQYYLLPSDVLSENLSVRGWSLENALDGYAKQGKYQIVCWLGTAMRTEPVQASAKVAPPDNAALSRNWLQRLARWPGVTVWLASEGTLPSHSADPAIPFTRALLAGLGNRDRKQNLAACLRSLQQSSTLKGFRSIGGVPPDLTLWAGELGQPIKSPQPEMILQVGHAEQVLDLVSTADGRLLITASQDSTIRVWSPVQNALLRVLTGHVVGARALALSGQDRWLVSGGGRGVVRIHDLAQNFAPKPVGRQPHDVNSHVIQIAMLPDAAHFVTRDSQRRAFLWDMNASSLTPQPWLKDYECLQVVSGGEGDEGAVGARCGDGKVRLFGPDGTGGTVIPAPSGELTALKISPDGRLLALGYEDGRIVLWEIKGARHTERKAVPGPVRHLAFSSSNGLVAGHDQGVVLIPITQTLALGKRLDLLIGRGAEKVAVSPDGSVLAVCSMNTGALHVWKLDADQPGKTILADAKAGALALAFSSDSRALITGTKLGSVKTWPLGGTDEEAPRTYPANRGKIQRLAASPGRRFLLMINDLNQTQLWDLSQRTCRRLPGTWTAAIFVNDDTMIVADRPVQEQPGQLVRIDRGTLAQNRAFFARSSGAFQIEAETRFDALVLSHDGNRIAAAASSSQEPLVCIWDTKSGRLTHWLTASSLKDAVSALSFSSDSRHLVSAGGSPEAKLWDLSAREGELASPAMTFQEPTSRNITSVQIRPGPHRQLVTGHRDGRLLLWSWADGAARKEVPLQFLAEGFFVSAVHDVRFTPEGRYLSAAGFGSMIWVAEMEPEVRPIQNLGTPPHHYEQINTLAVWPGLSPPDRAPGAQPNVPPAGPMLISGSDDTTVKFWDLDKRTLRGIFRAVSFATESVGPAGEAGPRELEWVLYTPDGHFDASEAGRKLVQFRHDERAHAMEQFDDTKLYTFDLGDLLRSGKGLEPATLSSPPPLVIDPPLRDDPTQAVANLVLSLGATNLKDLRLYHNGIPIPSGLEDRQAPLPSRHEVRVRLLRGPNRFYAMASLDGSFDSRSQEVEIRYEGPSEPGRLHVIALGVGNYQREKLSFAKRDAERLSEVLHARGLTPGQGQGISILLTDNDVNARNVADAFTEVGREVRGRPQDTVVLFLAGHTGVFENERFALLLPKYPFPADAPQVVAARGANPPVAEGAKVTAADFLPYSMLAINLMRLDALNRLVIVDACQAEMILSDPQVTAIRKWMEIGSRKPRTSYLMAARRGEPALEIEPLGHGLFTYVLLRGMREVSLRDEPKSFADLKLRPDADYNNDGIVTTAELDAYVKESLPPIAGEFPKLFVSRQAPGAIPALVKRGATATADQNMDQSLQLQSSTVSFRLIQLSRTAASIP
jgi:WD40 repeat protein